MFLGQKQNLLPAVLILCASVLVCFSHQLWSSWQQGDATHQFLGAARPTTVHVCDQVSVRLVSLVCCTRSQWLHHKFWSLLLLRAGAGQNVALYE